MGLERFRRNESGQIRQGIQTMIAHPIDRIDLLKSEVYGTIMQDFGSRISVLPDVSLPRVKQFFSMLREEIRHAHRRGANLDSLCLGLLRKSGTQNVLDHELAHIQKAGDLNIDLRACGLRYTFTSDSHDGVGLWMTFDMPRGIDPYTTILICLAPIELSNPDFMTVISLIGKLTDGQREEIHRKYGRKLRVDIREIRD